MLDISNVELRQNFVWNCNGVTLRFFSTVQHDLDATKNFDMNTIFIEGQANSLEEHEPIHIKANGATLNDFHIGKSIAQLKSENRFCYLKNAEGALQAGSMGAPYYKFQMVINIADIEHYTQPSHYPITNDTADNNLAGNKVDLQVEYLLADGSKEIFTDASNLTLASDIDEPIIKCDAHIGVDGSNQILLYMDADQYDAAVTRGYIDELQVGLQMTLFLNHGSGPSTQHNLTVYRNLDFAGNNLTSTDGVEIAGKNILALALISNSSNNYLGAPLGIEVTDLSNIRVFDAEAADLECGDIVYVSATTHNDISNALYNFGTHHSTEYEMVCSKLVPAIENLSLDASLCGLDGTQNKPVLDMSWNEDCSNCEIEPVSYDVLVKFDTWDGTPTTDEISYTGLVNGTGRHEISSVGVAHNLQLFLPFCAKTITEVQITRHYNQACNSDGVLAYEVLHTESGLSLDTPEITTDITDLSMDASACVADDRQFTITWNQTVDACLYGLSNEYDLVVNYNQYVGGSDSKTFTFDATDNALANGGVGYTNTLPLCVSTITSFTLTRTVNIESGCSINSGAVSGVVDANVPAIPDPTVSSISMFLTKDASNCDIISILGGVVNNGNDCPEHDYLYSKYDTIYFKYNNGSGIVNATQVLSGTNSTYRVNDLTPDTPDSSFDSACITEITQILRTAKVDRTGGCIGYDSAATTVPIIFSLPAPPSEGAVTVNNSPLGSDYVDVTVNWSQNSDFNRNYGITKYVIELQYTDLSCSSDVSTNTFTFDVNNCLDITNSSSIVFTGLRAFSIDSVTVTRHTQCEHITSSVTYLTLPSPMPMRPIIKDMSLNATSDGLGIEYTSTTNATAVFIVSWLDAGTNIRNEIEIETPWAAGCCETEDLSFAQIAEDLTTGISYEITLLLVNGFGSTKAKVDNYVEGDLFDVTLSGDYSRNAPVPVVRSAPAPVVRRNMFGMRFM